MANSLLTSTFIRFRDRLRGVAAGIIHDDTEADDVLHDAFCKLWTSARDISDEASALRLSYTTVRNSAIDSFRRQKSRPTVAVDNLADSPITDSDSDEQSEKEDLCCHLLELSRKILKEKHYRVFFMHDVENRSYPEIAETLELSQENVRAILSRARKTIREYYRKNKDYE